MIVPAKNEEHNIWATLAALYHQVDSQGNPLNKRWYEIIVLANNCTDATVEVAQAFARAHPDCQLHIVVRYLPSHLAHIGYVRRILMDEACHRLMMLNRLRGIIASTDGDTVVSPAWIHHTLEAVRQGADVVGGRIVAQPQQVGRRYHLQDVTYRYLLAHLEAMMVPDPADPWPRHFQNFGPSLAVTCEIYQRAGRLPVIASLEDVRFYEALQRCDARIRHCPKVRVVTSARTQGRVDFGFSVQLQQWEQMQQQDIPLVVQGMDEWAFRFTLQKQLRCAWQRKTFTLLQLAARSLPLSPYELYDCMRKTAYFGEFWQWLLQLPEVNDLFSQRFSPVRITDAIADLRQYVQRVKPFVPIHPTDNGRCADVAGARAFGKSEQKHHALRRRLADSL